MSITLTEKAVVGRRIIHDHAARKQQLPGIITSLNEGQGGGFWVRLDGDRHTFFVPPKFYDRVTFLDEVITPVPELPMGRFTPTAADLGGVWEGVPVCLLEDTAGGEHVIALTGDTAAARTAVAAYLKQTGWDVEFVDLDRLEARWAVFEWEPEDSDTPWTVNWDAAEGDDQAVRIHYLPA